MDRPEPAQPPPAGPPAFLPPEPPSAAGDTTGSAAGSTAGGPDGTAPPPRTRRWLRDRIPVALALLVLVPAATAVPWWLERRALLEQGTMPPSAVVADGPSADLAGSQWQFRGAVTGATGGEDPPPGTELVDAVFIVTPGDARASRLLLNSCEIRAVDDAGRTWDQTSEFSLRQLPEEVGTTTFGCGDADGEAVPADTGQGLVATFLVPEDAVAGLGFEVRVDTSEAARAPRPAAVLFRD
ncbi:hypothetical protein [Marinitenerispora sediminis]|uniref:Uncharacterized protein n=1 Tax=Marinitenerispora sediminis TaxID=1931232 RepID=A0A368T1W6_9ACTN|nr:hypothetical protein [Marinitenerispora sediminis]RCV48884.1 hypothetical protein DEF28_22325 [Marinitenerispora sediminis]RCV51334.1 hypothetical protein DEF23_20610 [Marinitenerispora sediminis]RCV54921.1 hypothetical protein DEF24_18630 [Marinitenerispora sediminis]